MGKFSAWFFGEPVAEDFGAKPTVPPSDIAVKLAKIIETSGERWAFEDDQGHAHSYDLGITVSLKGDVVWQGSRDEHVRAASCELLRTSSVSPDATHIANALKARRVRYNQELVEKKQREAEAARVARETRAADALDKLSRGECLEDPFAGRYRMVGMAKGLPPVPDYLADYERPLRRRGLA